MTAMNVNCIAPPSIPGVPPCPGHPKPPVIVLPVMPDGWVAPNE